MPNDKIFTSGVLVKIVVSDAGTFSALISSLFSSPESRTKQNE